MAYAVGTVIACVPPEVAQIITQKSSTAQRRNATLEIPMASEIPC